MGRGQTPKFTRTLKDPHRGTSLSRRARLKPASKELPPLACHDLSPSLFGAGRRHAWLRLHFCGDMAVVLPSSRGSWSPRSTVTRSERHCQTEYDWDRVFLLKFKSFVHLSITLERTLFFKKNLAHCTMVYDSLPSSVSLGQGPTLAWAFLCYSPMHMGL